jgi:hypothetical protein
VPSNEQSSGDGGAKPSQPVLHGMVWCGVEDAMWVWVRCAADEEEEEGWRQPVFSPSETNNASVE